MYHFSDFIQFINFSFPDFRLFNPAGGGAVPLPSNSPYAAGVAPPAVLMPGQVQANNPGGIPPQILMAAAMQDRPLPPSFGSASQPEPPNPLFRKSESEAVTKSPSVSPIQCSSPTNE